MQITLCTVETIYDALMVGNLSRDDLDCFDAWYFWLGGADYNWPINKKVIWMNYFEGEIASKTIGLLNHGIILHEDFMRIARKIHPSFDFPMQILDTLYYTDTLSLNQNNTYLHEFYRGHSYYNDSRTIGEWYLYSSSAIFIHTHSDDNEYSPARSYGQESVNFATSYQDEDEPELEVNQVDLLVEAFDRWLNPRFVGESWVSRNMTAYFEGDDSLQNYNSDADTNPEEELDPGHYIESSEESQDEDFEGAAAA